jgi:nitroreductase
MDVGTAIRTRRSVRRYKRKEIPDGTLRDILEAARLAPSAANRQAWEMIVVKDPGLKAELVPLCKNQKFIGDCSAFLVAIEDPSQRWSRVDAAIMLDHITLAAHEKGLGTCWIGAFDKVQVGSLLKVPPNKEIMACLTLGYPDEDPDARLRKPPEELFHVDHYGRRQ